MTSKLFVAICCLLIALGAPDARAEQPSLIVVVSVDQLRRDRLDADLPGGLGRVLRQGRVFVNASLNHAVTSTCPGHASILTGVNPGRAGIPGNSFIDKESWSSRYCVEDENAEYGVFGREEIRSPRSLRVTTLGDWLQSRYPEGKVYGVAGKDRSAITMAGHHADAAFWFDQDRGQFTSSGYYIDGLPDYVLAVNAEVPLAEGGLADLSDARAWEEDSAVFRLAKRIIEAEDLGTDGSPDLLALGLSATDHVGH
ncbi:MAG: alkaline phosphatase family protein, partial [Pseudomonadales bacterium]|nr:alkaline phosphatase family protein [Pseudomonadales bacterium]